MRACCSAVTALSLLAVVVSWAMVGVARGGPAKAPACSAAVPAHRVSRTRPGAINDVSPISGEPVGMDSPTIEYFSACGAGDKFWMSVASIDPDGPAAKAGLEEGDIIVSINGVTPSDFGMNRLIPELRKLLDTPDPITFKVDRIEEVVDITVTPTPAMKKKRADSTASNEAVRQSTGDNSSDAVRRDDDDTSSSPVSMGALKDDASVTVPLLMSRRAPAIEVMINDKGPYRFDLYFVTGPSELSRELADALGLTVDDADQVRIESLRIGDISIEGVIAKTVDPDEMESGSCETVGFLTLDVFTDHLVTLDFVKDEFRIEEGSLASTDDDTIVKYGLVQVDEGESPSVTLEIGDQKIEAYLSSSVSTTLHFPSESADSMPLANPPGMIGRVKTPKGEGTILGGQLTMSLNVGGLVFQEAQVRFSDLFERPNIGIGALNRYELTFDHANRRLRFHEPEDRKAIGFGRAAAVANLAEREADIRTAFNANMDKTRLVMILSPT